MRGRSERGILQGGSRSSSQPRTRGAGRRLSDEYMPNILVIDDFKRDQELLASPFRSGYDVRCAGDLEEAGRLLDSWWPDVALVDAIFPKKPYAPPSFQAGA